jgi:solute carrier family 25 phosphate transporter 3
MKFACFERTVEALYRYVIPKPWKQCANFEQLGVSFVADGEELLLIFISNYLAGIFCAVLSHPPDAIVSKLNEKKEFTLMKVVQNIGFSGRFWIILFISEVN